MRSSTDEGLDAYVERLVDGWPELTDEQRQVIASALGSAR